MEKSKVIKKVELKEEELNEIVGGSTAVVSNRDMWDGLKRILRHR